MFADFVGAVSAAVTRLQWSLVSAGVTRLQVLHTNVAHKHPCTHARKQMHDMDGSGWMNGMQQMEMNELKWMEVGG